MTVKEAYIALGGDYNSILSRFATEERVKRFALKFPNDKSYDLLCTSIASNDYKEAFRAAHTIKGICQNLSFDRLYKSAEVITEALRDENNIAGNLDELLNKVTDDYNITVAAINKID